MLNLITNERGSHQSLLDEIARKGARELLKLALEREVKDYIEKYKEEVDENGHRMVVRNGKSEPRTVVTGAGQVEVQTPRVNDKRSGEKFTSLILPPYLRKSPNIESLVPVLYLRGLSTNDFQEALVSILGEGASGFSSTSIVSLKKSWEREFESWRKRRIEDQFVYVWADGVNVKIRLGEDKKICLLVLMGVTETGEKKLISIEPGYRESAESWKILLRSLISRGFSAPLLAIADGALGFWSALEDLEEFKNTKHGRCWVHKIKNVMNCFPKRLQPQVKGLLHDMMNAEKRSNAELVKKTFVDLFHDKYPNGVKKLEKDWEKLSIFFPAAHWQHIRTTNPIESTFATVKLRTRTTRGAGSASTAASMAFKLFEQTSKK
ncbi:MAG: IS256 family transposase, partial [Bdellovibrionaceae bacterium]|nr:IS256 family transposase [Pseudobdellovibrionaceae bacterium]